MLGALFGALVATSVLGGAWVTAVRMAHLHVNLLGWAGLTLLATIVFLRSHGRSDEDPRRRGRPCGPRGAVGGDRRRHRRRGSRRDGSRRSGLEKARG